MPGNRPTRKHIFDGEKGETVFSKPLMETSQLYEYNEENTQLMARVKAAADERSYVLVAALVVEHRTSQFLAAWLPGHKKLTDNHDFTWSMRIDLIRAARLVPPLILRAVDVVRSVRNDFAHNLAIGALDEIDEGDKDRLRSLYNDIHSYRASPESARGKSTRQLFDGVTFFANAIGHYATNIQLLREVIEAEGFEDQLAQAAEQRSRDWEAEILSRPPEAVEIQGDMKIQRYGRGLVQISGVGPAPAEQPPGEPSAPPDEGAS